MDTTLFEWSPTATVIYAHNSLDQATSSDTWSPPCLNEPGLKLTEEQITTAKVPSAAERRCACPRDGCHKTFMYTEDLRRHQRHTHDRPSQFHCHYRRCPRSIPGHGFPRKDKLVDHLKSRYHELSHAEARYEVELHSPSRRITIDDWWEPQKKLERLRKEAGSATEA